ncbi:hypothetical protein BCU70_13075 [Vibrio sp. 10N.286.49.C2]|uniref:hypothetical protein n=1 Tax=unclassified Vibrio TaxID=2614977 RepID=UPI000C85A2FC|nr:MULTISPECIES: hypothetical protein [unclassified Vibrio]PMH39311.1 hypothetical protein BCU70_13075 [Vibrio sp. 10N.286.49.C2]PMH54339.1 hypothetical protein BCU66_11880 [Vibrio sp. 10N.286.49.B1]PMH79738.1 hypothetical protein BCU58_04530 [Vibrio sp. 10N.286.48.B7]
MLQERLERINELRKQAMADPNFVKSAEAHRRAIMTEYQDHHYSANQKPKTLSELYSRYKSDI